MRRRSSLPVSLATFIIALVTPAVFMIALRPPVMAADFPEPLRIIRDEGQFVFTDGSSYYYFKKDGSFKSGPLALSGREIAGTWTAQDRMFVIEGRWGWMNGVSPLDDYRKMTVYVSTPTGAETVRRLSPVLPGADVKIYKCYFIIEELQKIKGPPTSDKTSNGE